MSSLDQQIEELQAEIARLKALLAKANVSGGVWESEFAEELDKRNIKYEDFSKNKCLPFDFLVGDKKIQCKITHQPGKSADIRGDGHRGVYQATDFDYLVLKNGCTGDVYIGPANELISESNPRILTTRCCYKKFDHYKNNWHFLDNLHGRYNKRILEFDEWPPVGE
jgi:hypothetical protein